MKTLKTMLLAMTLLAAPAMTLAQGASTAAQPAVAATTATGAPVAPAAGGPTAVAPAEAPSAVKAAAATAAPEAAKPTYDYAVPEKDIGQPIPGGWHIQPQVTDIGKEAQWMHDILLMPIITIISLFVLGLLIWVVIRYRASANPIPSKTSHNTVIEIVWTLAPVLILLVIAVPSIKLLAHQYSPPKADLTIKVVGNQWYWSYEYPDYGDLSFDSYMLKDEKDMTPDEKAKGTRARTDADGPHLLAVDNRIVVPVGAVVKLIVTSNDVIHSFAVPAFWTKMDAVPGRLNETWFKADRPGVYFGQCSELCGARHAYMPIAVEVTTKARFAQWIASKGGTMPSAAAAANTASPAPTTDAAPVEPAPATGTDPAVSGTAAAPATTSQAATAQN